MTTQEAEKFAKDNGLLFMETSAKTGHNCQLLFGAVTEKVLEQIENGAINPADDTLGIKIGGQASDKMIKKQ